MEPVRINTKDFKLNNFINYYEDNVAEMLFDYNKSVIRINLIDKDYMDVITFDEDYEQLEDSSDYKNVLVDEEYALLFIIGKTHEGAEKFEFIDGTKYSMKHYVDDLYMEKNSIKDIGDLKLDLDHLVGLLVDVADNEYVMSIVNYEKGLSPRIEEIEESGDLEEIVKNFINRFTI